MQVNNMSMISSINGGMRRKCVADIKDQKQILIPGVSNSVEGFTFDYIGGEDVTQEEIFHVVGKPIVD